MMKDWVTSFAPELAAEGISSEAILKDSDRLLPGSSSIGKAVFERFVSLAH
jgi:hypothetical protein